MKGPYERLKYDLRRVWECPACKRRERTAGTVTFRHCGCRMKQVDGQFVVMKLVEDGVQRVGPAVVIKHEPLVPSESITSESVVASMTNLDEPQPPDNSASSENMN